MGNPQIGWKQQKEISKMFQLANFKTLKSTNEKAKEVPKPNLVIIADEQLRGKGRFNRNWGSSKGGIYLSIILEINNTKDIS